MTRRRTLSDWITRTWLSAMETPLSACGWRAFTSFSHDAQIARIHEDLDAGRVARREQAQQRDRGGDHEQGAEKDETAAAPQAPQDHARLRPRCRRRQHDADRLLTAHARREVEHTPRSLTCRGGPDRPPPPPGPVPLPIGNVPIRDRFSIEAVSSPTVQQSAYRTRTLMLMQGPTAGNPQISTRVSTLTGTALRREQAWSCRELRTWSHTVS